MDSPNVLRPSRVIQSAMNVNLSHSTENANIAVVVPLCNQHPTSLYHTIGERIEALVLRHLSKKKPRN